MTPKLFAQDKANHYFYGSLAAAIGGALCAAALIGLAGVALPPPWLYVLIALAAIASAAGLGWATEARQARLNAAAVARGEAPPHTVSEGDAVATALGGVSVALPWLVAALVVALTGP